MIDKPEFAIDDLVWHRTNGDDAGIVIGIIYRGKGRNQIMLYEVIWSERCTDTHYEGELTKDRPYFTSINKELE